MCASIRWQEVYSLSFLTSPIDITFQFTKSHCLSDTYVRCFFAECWLNACPYDIVNGQFTSKHYFLVGINVNNGSQPCIVKPKEIKKCRVLTEAIGVVGLVHACFVIAKKEQQSATHVFFSVAPCGGYKFLSSSMQRYDN